MGDIAELYQRAGVTIKTAPFAHQSDALIASWGKKWFAQLGEQGTGKTWVLINEAALLYAMNEIDSVLVLAPKGVDLNWQVDQVPKHIPDGVQWESALWRAGAKVKEERALLKLVGRGGNPFSFDDAPAPAPVRVMRWLFANWDAIQTDRGYEFIASFLQGTRAMVICDEAQRIKSPSSRRSKALMKMKQWSPWRRIATGTPITNSPFDMFSPFNWLNSSILGTTSFTAFKAEHARMVGPGDPLFSMMFEKMKLKLMSEGKSEEAAKKMVIHRMPQIVAKDDNGKSLYRNIEQLREKIAPHSFRVLKKDCLDLPDKIYKKLYFEMTPEQARVYEEARDKLRIWLDAETIQPLNALTALNKLAQIASGFYIETAEGITHKIPGDNPKMDLLRDSLEDIDGKVIIWANFKAEFADIRAACEGKKIVEYHGGVADKDRKVAIDRFQDGDAEVFIGHPKSGGTGLTLHAASTVIYYSNSYSLESRMQSEDRAHRIGQKANVLYLDLVARNTVDEKVIAALIEKADLAALVNGDLL